MSHVDPFETFERFDPSGEFGREEGLMEYQFLLEEQPELRNLPIEEVVNEAIRKAIYECQRFDVDPEKAEASLVGKLFQDVTPEIDDHLNDVYHREKNFDREIRNIMINYAAESDEMDILRQGVAAGRIHDELFKTRLEKIGTNYGLKSYTDAWQAYLLAIDTAAKNNTQENSNG